MNRRALFLVAAIVVGLIVVAGVAAWSGQFAVDVRNARVADDVQRSAGVPSWVVPGPRVPR